MRPEIDNDRFGPTRKPRERYALARSPAVQSKSGRIAHELLLVDQNRCRHLEHLHGDIRCAAGEDQGGITVARAAGSHPIIGTSRL